MDVEKLREYWWQTKSVLPEEAEDWVEKSYSDSISFWQGLVALQKKLSPNPPKSLLGEQYDFYNDCVLRHVESNQAFIAIEENGFVQTWTYKKLHRAVNYLVGQWLKQKVIPGQIVAIVLPPGMHFTVALLAALRMGLTICCLSPSSSYLGRGHLLHLLKQIRPDFVAAHSNSSLSDYPQLVVDELQEEDENLPPLSHAYSATQVMQLSLALHRQASYAVVSLDAETTYLHALRDALIILNLQPGAIWASTLDCPLRTQPCSTIMTLLAGASILHVSEKAVSNDPAIIKNEKLHLIGIPGKLQKLWTQQPMLAAKQLKGFYKTPLTRPVQSWQTFIQLNKLEEAPFFYLLIDNSYGGSILLSRPSIGSDSPYLRPSFGTPWSLIDMNGSGEDSLSGFGLFYPHLDQPISNLVLSQIENSCLISSALMPCLEGVTIPFNKIEEAARALPFVENCLLHSVPKIGELATHRLILLVFTDPLENSIPEKVKQNWTDQLVGQISQEMGSAFVPDQIEYYPLVPPMNGKSIDRNQCVDQFSKGLLSKKRTDQNYQLISILKKLNQPI